MKHKPIIGIVSVKHKGRSVLPIYCTTSHYLEQVKAAGGIPLQIPILEDTTDEEFKQLISACNGFLLPGGADFSPKWYGEELLENLSENLIVLSREVQEASLRFIRLLGKSGKPVLGICLGVQLMNVAFGGSLYQDIPTQCPSDLIHAAQSVFLKDRWKTAHQVTTKEDSLLRKITKQEILDVNSFHHQAIKKVAPGFEITGWAEDGLIEALENKEKNMLGVQWHPENLSHAGISEAQALFQWLVQEAM